MQDPVNDQIVVTDDPEIKEEWDKIQDNMIDLTKYNRALDLGIAKTTRAVLPEGLTASTCTSTEHFVMDTLCRITVKMHTKNI